MNFEKQPAKRQAAFSILTCMNRFDKKNIKLYILVLGLLIVFTALTVTGLYKCPLKALFGVPCPLCGITRAIISVLHGDWGLAFYYHPMWPVIVAAVLLYALSWIGLIRPSAKLVRFCAFGIGILLIACFVWRHITGSEVVKVDFEPSFLYRIIHYNV